MSGKRSQEPEDAVPWSPSHAGGDDLPGPPRNRNFALFDAMRAIAVLCVLAMHVGASSGATMHAWYGVATSHGKIGVRIFFVISGFLLYRPHVVEALGGARAPALRSYAWRRLLRIGPAYWVALTLLALWPGLAGVLTEHWWVYYGLVQAYRPRWLEQGLPVAWSLSIEVAFYAALPLLAWGFARIGRSRAPHERLRIQLLGIGALAVAGEAFRVAAFEVGRRDLNFTLPSMFLCFAVGMALAVVSGWLGSDERRWAWTRLVIDHPGACWTIAIGLYVAACFTPAFPRNFVGRHTTATWAAEQLLYAAISFFLILPAVFGEDAGGWPRRILANRFVAWMGAISYGIFLWHQPLLGEMARRGAAGLIDGWPFLSLFLVILPVSLLCGWLSFVLIERPAMRLRDAPPRRGPKAG